MSSSEPPVLEAREISLAYAGKGTRVEVLQELSMQVYKQELLCLVGPSGCGKSTLVRCLASLLPLDSGELLFRGRRVFTPSSGRFVVYQDSEQLLPWLTCYGNVAFAMNHATAGNPPARDRGSTSQRVSRLLELVGIAAEADRYPYALSGGMRQRVALARALAAGGDALLLDEPFGSLDALTRQGLQDLLLSVREQTKRTILFVTHDLREAVYLADRVLVMDRRGASLSERHITLPRPRDREAREVAAEVRALRKELERVSGLD